MKSIKCQVLRIKHEALRVSFLILCTLYSVLSSAQSGTWTWVSGSSQANATGVFGTQGIPSLSNHPPALYEPVEWKDKQGNFWIYGGSDDNYEQWSDVWKYNPVTKEWTWLQGDGLTSDAAVYGTQGVSNSSNTPGRRNLACVSWVDTSGNFWLFGGADSPNDLWRYEIGSNEWTWMKGGMVYPAFGVHGTQGIPAPSNNPGTRWETCSAWTDSLNNLWLFGGYGYDDNGASGDLNDLCKYDISANEWTWVKGSAYVGGLVNFGTKGIANASNDPGGRYTYTKWKDVQGNFWIMGGGVDYSDCFNDVWKYDLKTNNWTWMNGTNVDKDLGIYNAMCSFDDTNLPFSRSEHRSSVTDNCGRFWMFGGSNFNLDDYADCLNDLWVFDPQQLKWNWIAGTNAFNLAGNYGTLGVASPSNSPPPRIGAVSWWGNDNKFYLYGGAQYSSSMYYSDVWVFDPDTNCVSACGALAVVPPVANLQASKTAICENDCINFTDLSTGATSWQWLFAGAIDSTSTSQNPQYVCYLTAGIYNVTLIASNSGGSDTVIFSNYINVKATPTTPDIIQSGDTLYCSTDPSYTAYQWYADSSIINGATDTLLVVSKNDNYNVQVSNSNGCKIAVGINVILGIQNYVNDNIISLSPNPVENKFTVYGLQFTVARMEIYNVLGQTCLQSEIRNQKSEIDVSSFSSGIYFVQVVTDRGRWVGRFVKQ